MKEVWKKVENFEEYEVSNSGRIKNSSTGRFLSGSLTANGYRTVRLFYNEKGKRKFKNILVHQIVANHFLENPNPKIYKHINHIDEDKTRNDSLNLQWTTAKENANHGTRNKRISNGGYPVCEYDLEGNYIRTWKNAHAVAKVYNCSPRTVYGASKGDTKTCYGRQWRFYIYTKGRKIGDITKDMANWELFRIKKQDYKYPVEVDEELLFVSKGEIKDVVFELYDLLDKVKLTSDKEQAVLKAIKYLMIKNC